MGVDRYLARGGRVRSAADRSICTEQSFAVALSNRTEYQSSETVAPALIQCYCGVLMRKEVTHIPAVTVRSSSVAVR